MADLDDANSKVRGAPRADTNEEVRNTGADHAQRVEVVLKADNVTLTYHDGRNIIYAVRDVDLSIAHGEFVGVLG